MAKTLRLTVEPAARETLLSFISRMAAANGTNVGDFALDLGFAFKRIVDQEASAVAEFAELSGLSSQDLATLLSWTGERIGDVRMRFRGEVFISRALRNPVVRGCPCCIREQATDPVDALSQIAMAGDWLCRGVDICVKHGHLLVPLWTCSRVIERDNIGERLGEILPDVRSGLYDREPVEPSAYDLWIDRRLACGEDSTELAAQPLFAAMTFCSLLGDALLRQHTDDVDDRNAKALGFAHASRGTRGIREALDLLTRGEDGRSRSTQGGLHKIMSTLGTLYRDEPSFDGYRDIVRDYGLEIWPLGVGESLLGQTVTERRLHSLVSASKETGVGAGILNGFLTEAGAFLAEDTRSPQHKTFDAVRYRALLEEIPTLIGPIAMREAIGATKQELITLEEDGVLAPRTKVATIKSRWRAAEGLALIDELNRLAVPLSGDGAGWETLQMTRFRFGLSVRQLLDKIRDGSLVVAKRAEVFGYHGFVVEISAAQGLEDRLRQDRERADGGSHAGSREGDQPVSAFAREVGLRDKGAFLSLIEEGLTPATKVVLQGAKRFQWRMTRADVAAFHKRFTTSTVLVTETGLHRNTIMAALAAHNVPVFRAGGPNSVDLYRRKDVLPALKSLGRPSPGSS